VDAAPLSRVYHLAVVDLPAPPAAPVASQRSQPERHCPVEVRAIVQGDSRATTFTVIAWGEHSTLLSAGEGVKTRDGWLAVSKIASDHVILHRGDVAHRCELNPAAPGRRHRTR
jgi:type II secretory pathway component PulC